MALTSDRLREFTKKKLELVKAIDRNPSDTLIQELEMVETEISIERNTIISNDAKPVTAITQATPALAMQIPASTSIKRGKRSQNQDSSTNMRKLSDFF